MASLTPLQKWSYAIGNVPYSVKDAAFGNFVVFYYTQVLGLGGTLAGLAMFLAMTWDAVSDPVVGGWSDTLRTRWGRRHPMLVFGGLPTALLFLLVFPPDMGLDRPGQAPCRVSTRHGAWPGRSVCLATGSVHLVAHIPDHVLHPVFRDGC